MPGFRPRFFVTESAGSDLHGPDLSGAVLALSPEDSHHALRVLRLVPGDPCEVVITGKAYVATVVSATMPVTTRLESRLLGAEAGGCYLTNVGLVQRVERLTLLDHVIEKGTEVGASFFVLLLQPERAGASDATRRSVRWERIAREAAKQSKQTKIPALHFCSSAEGALAWLEQQGFRSLILDPGAPQRIDEILRPAAAAREAAAVTARETATEAAVVETGALAAQAAASSPALALWVGAEGGWTAAERDLFAARGLPKARLGRSVLRAETAGPVAVAVARLLLGDW